LHQPDDRVDISMRVQRVARPIEFSAALAALDWDTVGERLTREGCVALAAVLNVETCASLRGLFSDDPRFARTVVMDRPEFAPGTYRCFAAPLPDAVDELRRAMYVHVAPIANRWRELLGETERYPPEWEDFRALCDAAGQTTPTPILLKYGPG